MNGGDRSGVLALKGSTFSGGNAQRRDVALSNFSHGWAGLVGTRSVLAVPLKRGPQRSLVVLLTAVFSGVI
jgi:hypothetical protein